MSPTFVSPDTKLICSPSWDGNLPSSWHWEGLQKSVCDRDSPDMSAPWSWMHLVQGRVFAALPLPWAPLLHSEPNQWAAALAVWREFGFETVLLHASQVAFRPLFFSVLLVLLEWLSDCECQVILNKKDTVSAGLPFLKHQGYFVSPALPSHAWLPHFLPGARSSQCHSHPLPVVRPPNGRCVLSGKAWAPFLARHLRKKAIWSLDSVMPPCLFQWWHSVNLYQIFPLSQLFNLKSGLCRDFKQNIRSLCSDTSVISLQGVGLPRPHSEGRSSLEAEGRGSVNGTQTVNPDQLKTGTFPQWYSAKDFPQSWWGVTGN